MSDDGRVRFMPEELTSKDADNSPHIDAITVPFQYWSAKNRDKLPEYANVFTCSTYPLNKPNNGNAADLCGRLRIPILPQESLSSNSEKVKSALRRVNKLFAQRQGYHSLLFKTFIPFSTRHLKDTCRSLFPFTCEGREHLASKGLQQSIVGSLVVGSPLLIADFVTLAFRLSTLIPRVIYQQCLQEKACLEGIQSDVAIDWAKGTVVILTYSDDMSGDGTLRMSTMTPPHFYLG